MPKVSIIMPVYNKADYLKSTLEALLTQKFREWELIIVNDGSTDDSELIIRKYVNKDKRILYKAQKNEGVSSARNTGLKMASGEWIWFVDADDMPDTEFLFNIFSLEHEMDGDVIVGFFDCVKNNSITHQVKIEKYGKIDRYVLPELFMKHQYSDGFWGYLWNKLLRREFVNGNEIVFTEGLTLAEDLKFMVKIYNKNPNVHSVPYRAISYTMDALNSSSGKKVDYWEQLKIQLEIKEWIIDCKHKVEFTDFFKKIISKYAAFVILYGYEDNENCCNLAKKLLKDDRISSQLSIDNVDLLMLPIVWCLIKKKIFLMKEYLILQKIIRKVYRFMFKKE